MAHPKGVITMARIRKIGQLATLPLKAVVITALVLMLGAFGFSPLLAQPAEAALSGNHLVYNLYATDGYVTLADGTPMYIYGFVGGLVSVNGQPRTGTYTDRRGANVTNHQFLDPTAGPVTAAERQYLGAAHLPAPVIYAAVGDIVEIRLKNLGVSVGRAPNDPHSIHLHGLDTDAANDGVPETSLGAVPANSALPGAGNVIVYMFAADHAGTYMYHCHQEADIHVQMGMYGALVIYNQGDAGALNGPGSGPGTLYGWQYDRDYIMLLSEIDTRQHTAEERGGGGYNPITYQPQYWMINGLSFPNTIHVAPVGARNPTSWWTDWLASHKGYDPLIVGSVTGGITDTRGEKVLLRFINLGFETQPMHMHGFHGKIIGSDARGWPWANEAGETPFGQGLEKNTLTIGSGETYDWLIDFGQQAMAAAKYAPQATSGQLDEFGNTVPLTSTFSGGTQSKYTPANGRPVSNTDPNGVAIPDPFNPGFPYIGGPTVSGAVGHPMEIQLFPFHNHDDYKATNNGVYPGGMFTMIGTTP
jgi:manganese oxidase